MFRRRLAAAALVASAAALLAVPGVAPGLLKGDVYVIIYVNGRLQLKGVPFKTVSDHLLKLPSGSISPQVAAAGYVVQQRRSSG
jgi:hypothetical protein